MFVYSAIPIIPVNNFQQYQGQNVLNNNVQGIVPMNNFKAKRQTLKPHSKFTEEEDIRLKELVQEHGENSWIQIASLMPGRNSRQCRERWLNYLTPKLNTKTWTPEEDSLLLEKQKEFGTSWVRISKFFEGRTDQMCKNRFFLLQRKLDKKPRKQRNMTIVPQATPTIIGTPFFIQFPTNGNIMNVNNNMNYFPSQTATITPTSSSMSSTASSPISLNTASPIQTEVKKENLYLISEEKEYTEPEADFDEPIVGETTDLGFADSVYQDNMCDSYGSFCDEMLNNLGAIENCDDFFSF